MATRFMRDFFSPKEMIQTTHSAIMAIRSAKNACMDRMSLALVKCPAAAPIAYPNSPNRTCSSLVMRKPRAQNAYPLRGVCCGSSAKLLGDDVCTNNILVEGKEIKSKRFLPLQIWNLSFPVAKLSTNVFAEVSPSPNIPARRIEAVIITSLFESITSWSPRAFECE